MELRNVIIIGGGSSGFAAGIYAARAMLNPLLFTGQALGGQLSLTTSLENYPGFTGGQAMEFIETVREQAEHFGTEVMLDAVTEVDFGRHPFTVKTYDTEYRAKSVIVCTGSSPRVLGIPGEKEYGGRGVSYCATCDGFFFRDKRVIVVGGGDAALEEAMFLTTYASEVTIVHRRDQLRASRILQDRAIKNEKIAFIWSSVVEEIRGNDGKVTDIRLKDLKTGKSIEHETDGVFVFIGHIPNTDLFGGALELDTQGYITIDRHHATSIPGVYAAGDVHDSLYRQAVTAAGAGAAAAISVRRFLEELESEGYPAVQSRA